MFQVVDTGWKDMMLMSWDNPDALVCGTHPGRKELLMSYNKDLDKIEKKLEAYLETKRQAFPRYFLFFSKKFIK